MTTRPSLLRLTASAKNASAAPDIAVAGYSLMRSSVTWADAGRASVISAAKERSRAGLRIRGTHRAVAVGVEIARVLQPDREAEQVGRAGRAWSLDRGPMLDQAFDPAQRSRALPDLDARGCVDRGALAAFQPHRHHAREAAHLALGERMAGKRE